MSTLTSRQRTGVLATMCLALIAVVASVSGLNVALSELSVELGASTADVLWIVNAYTLTLAALLLAIGELGDRFGRRRILLGGLGIFVVASGLSATADTAGELIAFRSLAGLGAAMIMPATLSIITASFPADERGRAVGIWAGFAGAGGILGMFASAAIIDTVTWPWLFAAPAVAAVAAAGATAVLVPNTRNTEIGGYDALGAVLSILAVGGLVLGIHEGPEKGWTDGLTIAGLAVGVVASIAFLWWERRTAEAHETGGRVEPLIDVRVFSDRMLAAGSLALTLNFAMMFGAFLLVLQYLQAVLGYSALTAASGLLPMAVVMMSLSPRAPGMAQRLGFARVIAAGSASMAVGFAVLALVAGSDPSYFRVLPGLLVIGFGVGLMMSPSTTAITEALPEEKQGVASALNDTVREFGSSIGIALIGSLASAGYRSSIDPTLETLPDELAHTVGEGIGPALAVAGAMGADGAAIVTGAQDAFLDGWVDAMAVAAVLAVVCGLAVSRMLRPTATVVEELEPVAEPVGV